MANRGTHHRVSKPPAMPPQPQPTIPPQGVIDPTANVLSLVAAAIQRQDDLRDIELNRADDMRELTAKFQKEIAELREKHQQDIDTLRASYQRELSVAEANRIDASSLAESRRIDAVLAGMKADVALASEKAGATAAALATSVASAAVSTAAQMNELRNSHDNRLAVLEKNQYSSGGAQTQKTEGTKNIQWVITLIVGAVMASLGMGITILFFLLRGSH